MNEQPNLGFDIDALFDHLVNELEHQMTDELNWIFSFSSPNLSTLESLGEQMKDEFVIHLETEVSIVAEDGTSEMGDPMLALIRLGALGVDEVKSIASRMKELASSEKVTYQGVSCYEGMDDEEMFGWLDLDDARWRLKHFSDMGLGPDEGIPWAFLMEANDLTDLKAAGAAIAQAGYERIECFEEPDEEGVFTMCLFSDGTNNEVALGEAFEALQELVSPHQSEVVGIQFYSEEELLEFEESDSDE